MKSRFTDVYEHLKRNDIEIYFTGQHLGDAKSKYVVIRDAGGKRLFDLSTTIHYIDLMIYVPFNKFSDLEPFCDEVRRIMKGMYPMIKQTYLEQQVFMDDSNKSATKSLQYKYYKQIKEQDY